MNSRRRSVSPWIRKSRAARFVWIAAVCFASVGVGLVAADEPASPMRATYPQVSESACPLKIISIPGQGRQ